MRAIWVDEGNDADYTKLKSLGIESPFYSVRDPRVTKSYLQMVQSKGFSPGIFAAWNWPETGVLPPYIGAVKGAQFATWVSQQLERIAPGTAANFPMVCLNIETQDVPYILGALRQWRKHRLGRVTDWTLMGHQGGLFSPGDAALIAKQMRYTVPQCYNGAMTQVWDSFSMALDLTQNGFPITAVRPFYDAAHLEDWWDGYAFSQGRLP